MSKIIKDNRSIREESVKFLLTTLLLDIETNTLSKIEKQILIEVLLNGKSFNELTDTLLLTTSRQRTILKKAVSRLNSSLLSINDKLRIHDTLLSDYYKVQKAKEEAENKLIKQKPINTELKKILNLPIQKAGFSKRVQNVCLSGEIHHVSDLVQRSVNDILQLRNSGKKGITEIESFFEKNKLWWKMEL